MSLKRYCEGDYIRHHPSWHAEDAPWKVRQIMRCLQRNQLEPRSVCDIGCGAGNVLFELSKELTQARLVGYEISPDAFALCSQHKAPHLEYRNGSPADFAPEHYDLAISLDVFEHIEDYFGFLRLLHKMGEWKLLHIPLDMSVYHVMFAGTLMENRQTAGHLHYFTADTALATLQDCGYEIVDHFYTRWALELPGRGIGGRLKQLVAATTYLFCGMHLGVRLVGGSSLMVLAR